MIKPYYQDKWVTIYHGDCREVLPQLDVKVDLVLTDPPYPDGGIGYCGDTPIDLLNQVSSRQLVFWSAIYPFPLEYSTIHIWDKCVGGGAEYERIFERNGQCRYHCYRAMIITNPVRAKINREIMTGHPSQKPQRLIDRLVLDYSKVGDLVLDPFLGSGTTCFCAKKLNRYSIGIEIEEKYCEIAARRCSQEVMELKNLEQ